MLNENLKKLMLEFRIDVKELSIQTGVKAPVIYKLISGDTPNPSISSVCPIANFFGVNINQLIGDEPINPSRNLSLPARCIIPLISWSEVSDWDINYKLKKRHKTVSIDFQPGDKVFALTIETTDLFPTFPEETILIIDPDTAPSHKSYVIVCSDKGLANVKQVFFDNDSIYLKPIVDEIPAVLLKQSERLYGTVLEAKIKFNKKITTLG